MMECVKVLVAGVVLNAARALPMSITDSQHRAFFPPSRSLSPAHLASFAAFDQRFSPPSFDPPPISQFGDKVTGLSTVSPILELISDPGDGHVPRQRIDSTNEAQRPDDKARDQVLSSVRRSFEDHSSGTFPSSSLYERPQTPLTKHANKFNDKHHLHYQRRPKYRYKYRVDDHYGNHYGHEETRDGHDVKGSYRTLLPDGRVQVVTYYVSGDSGFNAKVTYEGKAHYKPPVLTSVIKNKPAIKHHVYRRKRKQLTKHPHNPYRFPNQVQTVGLNHYKRNHYTVGKDGKYNAYGIKKNVRLGDNRVTYNAYDSTKGHIHRKAVKRIPIPTSVYTPVPKVNGASSHSASKYKNSVFYSPPKYSPTVTPKFTSIYKPKQSPLHTTNFIPNYLQNYTPKYDSSYI